MDWNNIPSYAVKKMDKSVKLKDFPHITENGRWITTEDGYWSGGFWVGLLWFSYNISGDEKYKESAYEWLKRLESKKNDRNMLFDLGFMFYPSFVLGYKITNDDYLKEVALEAADTLLTFFNIAYAHSKRTIEEFVREDYSTIHVMEANNATEDIH